MITPVIDEADHKTDKHAYLSFTRDLHGAYSTSVPPENYIPRVSDGVAHRGWKWRRPHRSGCAPSMPSDLEFRLPRSVAEAKCGAASSRGS